MDWRQVIIRIFTFYLFLKWFHRYVSEDRKYVCGRRLNRCINTRKFKGLDSRKIKSLPEINGTSFQSSQKINRMLITKVICIQWKFTTPDNCSFAKNWVLFFPGPLSSVHLFQSNQCGSLTVSVKREIFCSIKIVSILRPHIIVSGYRNCDRSTRPVQMWLDHETITSRLDFNQRKR